jgi:REP element-mobilizing transposase RayT
MEYPSPWYHAANRGRRGEQVFEHKDDYELFVEIPRAAVQLFAPRASAFCPIPNHYHLPVQTPDANLSRCMRHIKGVHTQRYNSGHSLDGRLFQADTRQSWYPKTATCRNWLGVYTEIRFEPASLDSRLKHAGMTGLRNGHFIAWASTDSYPGGRDNSRCRCHP